MLAEPKTLAVVGVLAAALTAGALEFPHALEPGRSDAAGIVLNTVVDHSAGATPNDWYSAFPTKPAIDRGNTLIMRAPATGRMAISRILPVFPHQCYELTWHLDVRSGEGAVVVYNEKATQFIDFALIAPRQSAPNHLRFNSGNTRRITLAIGGRIGTRASLASMRLARLSSDDRCGTDRPGNNIGVPLRAR